MKDEVYTVKISKEAIASMEDTAKFLKENNIIRNDVNINDIVDSSFTDRRECKLWNTKNL